MRGTKEERVTERRDDWFYGAGSGEHLSMWMLYDTNQKETEACALLTFTQSDRVCVYLQSPSGTRTRSGPSHWCRWRYSHRVVMHTHLCQVHSYIPESQGHKSSETLPLHSCKWLRSGTDLINTHLYLPHRSPPQTRGHSHIQSLQAAAHTCRCSCKDHRCNQSHEPCSPSPQTLQDTCRSIHSAGPHTESGDRSTDCCDTRPPPPCSYHHLVPLYRCTGTQCYLGCWCSFHMEQRSRHHKVHHSFCPCSGPLLSDRYRHSHPQCPHRKLRSDSVQTDTSLM